MVSGNHFELFKRITYQTGKWTGSIWASLFALTITIVWVIAGPIFGFSQGWQMLMNSISSAVTFVMVFLLQRSQNRDSLAMQMKLNEIISAIGSANNHLINIEDLSEAEIMSLRKSYDDIASGPSDPRLIVRQQAHT